MDPSFGVILRRTSKILPVKLAMSPLPISIVRLPTQGMSKTLCQGHNSSHILSSLIEYSTREEADGAIRDLDGKEIRGTPVRVALDEVSCIS
jgi:hypothetical protein